jgi:hypothetical protein
MEFLVYGAAIALVVILGVEACEGMESSRLSCGEDDRRAVDSAVKCFEEVGQASPGGFFLLACTSD